MADLFIECERCRRKYQVASQHAGKAIRCRNCDHVIPIPRVLESRPGVAQRAMPDVEEDIEADDTETFEEQRPARESSGASLRERRRERRSRILETSAAREQTTARWMHPIVGVCSALITVLVILGIQSLAGRSRVNDQSFAGLEFGAVQTTSRTSDTETSADTTSAPGINGDLAASANVGTQGGIPPVSPWQGDPETAGSSPGAGSSTSSALPQPGQSTRAATSGNIASRSGASSPANSVGRKQRFGKSNYSIELPGDFVQESVSEEEGIFTAVWRSSDMSFDKNARLTFSVRTDPTITAGSRPPLYNQGGVFPGGEIYLIGGSTIDTVSLGGSEFYRLTYPQDPEKQAIKWIMMCHFDGVRVKLAGESAGPVTDEKLLAIAATFSSSDPNYQQPKPPTGTGFGNAAMALATESDSGAAGSSNGTEPGNSASRMNEGSGSETGASWGGSGGGRLLPIDTPPGSSRTVSFSGPSPKFILNRRKVLNALTGDLVAELPPELDEGVSTISPDGRKVAHHAGRYDEVAVINVYSCETPDAAPLRIENSEGTWRISTMAFLDANRLIIHAGDWIIWDSTTGRKMKTMEGSSPNDAGFALGENGKYMAIADHRSVVVYDTSKAQIVARMASAGNGRDLDLFSCYGLAFSPDMKELAGLFGGGQFVVWSNKGEVLAEETLSEISSVGTAYSAVSCLPDNSGWFLCGSKLLDRKSMNVIWEIVGRSPWDTYSAVMDQNTVMTSSTREDALIFVTIPWEKIRAAQAGQDPAAKPLLARGGSVSVECRMGEVRFADPNQTKTAIMEAITKRLAASEISVADNQPVKLVVNYTEKDEGLKNVRSGGSVTPVSDTSIDLTVELRIEGQEKPLWQDRRYSSTGFIVRTELTPQAFRNDNFESIISGMGALNFPTRISSDGNSSLPIRTNL